jgi:hypothetical protein
MANFSNIHDVIVSAQTANLTAHTYTEIYGGAGGCNITVNGVNISVASSTNINIWVKTVSGGAGCWLLGTDKNVYQGSTNL